MEKLKNLVLCVMPTLLLLVLQETEQILIGPLEIRLVGGANQSEGRLEVRKDNGSWGTVCDDSWGASESNVVCRQLGISELGKFVSARRFPQSTGTIWLDDVDCVGNETSLGQCSSRAWATHNCGHSEDVGVICRMPEVLEVRLVGGPDDREGRLEVRKPNGTWGTVCDDRFGTTQAIVICKQLGFEGFGELARVGEYGPGTGPIWLDDVDCTGRETNLGQCSAQDWGEHNCGHVEDVGLICHRSPVRLQPQNLPSKGIPYGSVEVLSSLEWVPICATNWDDTGAKVVCRSMGYVDGVALCCSQLASQTFYPSLVVTINCTGTELSVADCQQTSTSSCSSLGSAICYNTTRDSVNMTFDVRLVNGSSNWGRVEVRHRGVWGFVCGGPSWTDAGASVVCKELGFHGGGVRFGGPVNPRLTGSAWITGQDCTGNETSLEQCVVEPWGQATSCSTAAYVLCYNTDAPVVRLAGGGASYGRVEITMDGETYTVCDNSWYDTDAQTVCKQLGFLSGQPILQSYYGDGSGSVALDRVSCSYTDTSLMACRSGGWLQTAPVCNDHSKDASVVCFGEVQLLRGDHSTGMLIIMNGSAQYSVCSSNFSDTEATVACRELGFEHGRSLAPGSFGYSYTYRALVISCSGSETRISSCHSSLTYCGSSSTNYASVHCYNGSLSTASSLSLQGGPGIFRNSFGRLMVTLNGVQGKVCPDQWDDLDARVACRQLGYRTGSALAFPRSGFGSYVLNVLTCTGNETSVFSCQREEMCPISAFSLPDPGVMCFNDTPPAVQLVGGATEREGLVQVVYGGQVGTVCTPSAKYDLASPRVVCRQLGHADGEYKRFPREGTEGVSLTDVYCSGSERSIFMCRNGGFLTPPSDTCDDHQLDLGVLCFNYERLIDKVQETNTSVVGIVLVYAGSQWNYLCGDFFDDLNAQVVCRNLGYGYGRALPTGALGYQYIYNVVPSLNCSGTEESLADCPVYPGDTCRTSYRNNYATALCSKIPVVAGIQSLPGLPGSRNVLVMADGVTSFVCPDNWDDAAATVYCRDQGYLYGTAILETDYITRRTTAAYLVNSVNCTGRESTLSECPYSTGWTSCRNGYSNGASVICHNDRNAIQIELIGGPGRNAGQVQVTFNGIRGPVCDSSFTNDDATVVCRTLGFTGGVAAASTPSESPGPFYLNYVRCTGSEDSIWRCPLSTFNRTSCPTSYSTPRVRCTGNVRLDANEAYGAVQFTPNATLSSYKLVCDDNFTDREASVACRDLGFSYGIHMCCSAFGYKSVPIEWTRVRCTGTETLFSDCSYSTSLSYCPSRKYASAVCSNTPPGAGYSVSLETSISSLPEYGRVKVKHMGLWGYVCAIDFDNKDANVICREAGFAGGLTSSESSYSGDMTSALRWLSNLECDGTESHLSRCRNIVWGNVTDCQYYSVAAAFCYRSVAPDVRLVNSTTGNSGRLEVWWDGDSSRAICAQYWTDVHAELACKGMGFASGRLLGSGTFGKSYKSVLINGVNCDLAKSPQSLLDCDLTIKATRYSSYCSSSDLDPSVQCFRGPVRLRGSKTENYGRLEVQVNNAWTAVCDEGFDQVAAQVACRTLGFLYARPQCCSALGRLGKNPTDARQIGYKINRCRGDEANLMDCDVSTTATCSSGKYASVLCSNTSLQEQELTVRLREPRAFYGMVEVNRYGFWGPVCNSSWSDREANATCHDFGYSYGISFYGSQITDKPFLVGGFQCTGLEDSLASCTFKSSEEDLGCSETPVAAGVLCSRQTETRLGLTGGGRHYGRLDMLYEGQWWPVSSDYFSSTNADVACRQLGFVGGQTAPSGIFDDGRPARARLSNVACKGYEKSLFECPLQWGYSSSSRNPYVICSNTTRLYGGNSLSMGVVQINRNNRWGSVCDGGWTSQDTMVACRDLGFDNGYRLCCQPFGTGSTPIGDNFRCTGTEEALNNCSHSAPEGLRYCTHEAVSVACYNGPAPSDINFTLYGWPSESSGEVQVTFMNVSGRICSDGWDDTDARVFCRGLGFPAGQAFKHTPTWSRYWAPTPYWVTELRCTGTESSLKDCPKTIGAVSGCSSTFSAGATCLHVEGIQYNLTGSSSPNEGRLEVKVNGTWGTVCSSGFGSQQAKVVCRMFGYVEGKLDYSRTYPNPPSDIYDSSFQCTGSESTLDDCPHSGWRRQSGTHSYCTHSRDVNVICFDDVRIREVYDPETSQGPVFFYSNGTWYTLCDTGFDDLTAGRVCQDLGFVDGKAVCCSAYGTSYYTRRYQTNMNYTMQCRGTERDSTECLRPGGCLSTNYASVVCFNSTREPDDSYSFGFEDNTKTSGYLAVTHLGVVGRICNTFWDDADARVLCRSRGHADGIAYHYSKTNYQYQSLAKRGPYWMSDVSCTGNEASLGDCPFNDRLHLGNCSTADLAGALCFNDSGIQYRIADAGHPGAGRVEISVDGVWGTVCDSYWDDEDASVLCRSLHYTGGYAVPNAFYGKGTGPIWLSSLVCSGMESSLDKCPHSGFNDEVVVDGAYSYGCTSHDNDASVVCNGNIKLSLGFNASMGAVMVYLGNTWTLICDEGFDTNSAISACRSVGFVDGASVSGSVFGQLDPSIGINNMQCNGREKSLLDCSYEITTSCSSRSYASVICNREPLVDSSVKVRITQDNANDPSHGFVDVQMDGVWGAVCAAGFGNTEATVVCKELGYVGGVPYGAHRRYNSNNNNYKKPILMSDVRCSGSEKTLTDCQHTRKSATSRCDYYDPRAGVLCYNDTNGISYRLIGDTTDQTRGRVEMQYEGQWGLICIESAGSRASGPACRNLGHRDGLITSSSRYEIPPTERFWFYELFCQGNESSIPECGSTGFNDSSLFYYRYSCRNSFTLHVECYSKDVAITDLRLVGGDTNMSGRVEVFLQGPDQWGTVCDTNWNDVDATVVCNQQGYATGKAVPRATFGEGTGKIWLDNVGCLGSETRLQDCALTGYGDNYCRHSQDAGVVCSGVYVPPPTTTTTTVPQTYSTASQPFPVTSSGNLSMPSSQMLTPRTSDSNTAAIVVPIIVVLAAVAIAVAAVWYRRRGRNRPEMLVTDGERRPTALARARVRFVNHVRGKMGKGTGVEDANGSANYSHGFASYDPGLSNPVYDITIGAGPRPGEDDL